VEQAATAQGSPDRAGSRRRVTPRIKREMKRAHRARIGHLKNKHRIDRSRLATGPAWTGSPAACRRVARGGCTSLIGGIVIVIVFSA
jgi:hypothetical protein